MFISQGQSEEPHSWAFPAAYTAQPAPGQAWEEGSAASVDGNRQVALGIGFRVGLRPVLGWESCAVLASVDGGVCTAHKPHKKFSQVHSAWGMGALSWRVPQLHSIGSM